MPPTSRVRIRVPAFLAVLAILPTAQAAASCEIDRIEAFPTDSEVAAFIIEIADDPGEQAQGLMFRPSMPADAGMLFIFDPPRPASFWMQNTMIPLDMLFIGDDGRVESISERRDTYSQRVSNSDGPVRAVLEINGGLARQLGIGPGTQLRHPAFRAAPEEFRCGQ